MATENSGEATHEAALAVAEEIGATFLDGQIQQALTAAHEAVEAMTGEPLSWSDPRHDITLQNIQARLRGMLIWTIANIHNALLLVTSNKSEAAVGYTTMDGDSSGGLAPIADVPKSLVKLYLAWAADVPRPRRLRSVEVMEATRRASAARARRRPTRPTSCRSWSWISSCSPSCSSRLDPVEMFRRLWPAMSRLRRRPRAVRRRRQASSSGCSASPSGSASGSRSASA